MTHHMIAALVRWAIVWPVAISNLPSRNSFQSEPNLTANQYRTALDRLGLTQAEAARLFRIGARTGRRWAEKGVQGIPVILLRLLLAKKITREDIEATA